jgi:hypothetical protein
MQIVVRAAQSQSNGHEHCAEILRACEIVMNAIHYPHPDDPDYCLCGKVCTRNNPHTAGDPVDCPECVVHKFLGTQAEVD